jgi:glutamate racemase
MAAIGVFDSGVGGITVLRALKERWPSENFVYLADTARLPYGSKSLHTISHYVDQCLAVLSRYDLKAVVVACNSASTAVLEKPPKSDVPVFNVIEPGARKAVETSASGRIGVLGTRATVFSEAYPRAIRKLKSDAEVFQQPCPLFVPLVEEGWVDDPVTNLIVYRYIQALSVYQADTLILGCTHYPVLHKAITKAAGPSVQLVDSSHGLIEDMEKSLRLSESGPAGQIQVLCTDFSPRLQETLRLLMGPTQLDGLETIDI